MRRHHEKLLVAFDEIETPEDAKAFVGCVVSIEAQDVVLGAGEYLDRDLIGMRLLDETGVDLGRVVSGVVHYPAQDCLVVEPGKKLVPLVKAFIRRVDLDRRAIVTSLPDGLFD